MPKLYIEKNTPKLYIEKNGVFTQLPEDACLGALGTVVSSVGRRMFMYERDQRDGKIAELEIPEPRECDLLWTGQLYAYSCIRPYKDCALWVVKPGEDKALVYEECWIGGQGLAEDAITAGDSRIRQASTVQLTGKTFKKVPKELRGG